MKTLRLLREILYRISNFIFVFFRPHFWLSNYPVDWDYDKFLRFEFKEHGIKRISEFEAMVGHTKVWVSNYPYAFGSISGPQSDNGLPSQRLRKAMMIGLGDQSFESYDEAIKRIVQEYIDIVESMGSLSREEKDEFIKNFKVRNKIK